MNDKYGVPRDIYTKVKIIGLFMLDIVFVGGSGIVSLMVATKVFPKSQWIQMFVFILLTMVLALYLILPTNGGKKNWNSMYLYFRRRKRRYISVDYKRGDRRGY